MTVITVTWDGASQTVRTSPTPPRVEGRHAFVALLTFLVRDPDRPPLLDRENLHSAVPAFCWWCRADTDDGTPCRGYPG